MTYEIVNEKFDYAMQQLLPEHKEILILIDAQCMSYRDAAFELDLPVQDMRRLLSEARESLQVLLNAPMLRKAGQNQLPPLQREYVPAMLCAA